MTFARWQRSKWGRKHERCCYRHGIKRLKHAVHDGIIASGACRSIVGVVRNCWKQQKQSCAKASSGGKRPCDRRIAISPFFSFLGLFILFFRFPLFSRFLRPNRFRERVLSLPVRRPVLMRNRLPSVNSSGAFHRSTRGYDHGVRGVAGLRTLLLVLVCVFSGRSIFKRDIVTRRKTERESEKKKEEPIHEKCLSSFFFFFFRTETISETARQDTSQGGKICCSCGFEFFCALVACVSSFLFSFCVRVAISCLCVCLCVSVSRQRSVFSIRRLELRGLRTVLFGCFVKARRPTFRTKKQRLGDCKRRSSLSSSEDLLNAGPGESALG